MDTSNPPLLDGEPAVNPVWSCRELSPLPSCGLPSYRMMLRDRRPYFDLRSSPIYTVRDSCIVSALHSLSALSLFIAFHHYHHHNFRWHSSSSDPIESIEQNPDTHHIVNSNVKLTGNHAYPCS